MRRNTDDNAETAVSRLEAYRSRTAALTTYYADRNILETMNAMGEIDAISTGLTRIVEHAMQ